MDSTRPVIRSDLVNAPRATLKEAVPCGVVVVLIGETDRADAAHDGKTAHQDQQNESERQVGPFHRV